MATEKAKVLQRLHPLQNISEFLQCVERITGWGSTDGVPLTFVMKLVTEDQNTSNNSISIQSIGRKDNDRPRVLSYKGNVVVDSRRNTINLLIDRSENMTADQSIDNPTYPIDLMATGDIPLIGGISSNMYVQHSSCKAVVQLDSLGATVIRKIENMVKQDKLLIDNVREVVPYRLVSLKLFVERKAMDWKPDVQELISEALDEIEEVEKEGAKKVEQKKKAKEIGEENKEIKELKQDFKNQKISSGNERQALENQKMMLRKEKEQLHIEKKELLKNQKDTQEQKLALEKMESDLDETRKELDDEKREVEKAREVVDKYMLEANDELKTIKEQLQAVFELLQTELNEEQLLRQQNIDMEKQNGELRKSFQNLKKERDELRDSCQNLKEERDELRDSCQNLKKERDELRDSCQNSKKERDELRDSCQNLKEERDELRDCFKDLKKEKDELKDSCKDLDKEKDELRHNQQQLNLEKMLLLKNQKELQQMFMEFDEERHKMEITKDELEKALEQLHNKKIEEQLPQNIVQKQAEVEAGMEEPLEVKSAAASRKDGLFKRSYNRIKGVLVKENTSDAARSSRKSRGVLKTLRAAFSSCRGVQQ